MGFDDLRPRPVAHTSAIDAMDAKHRAPSAPRGPARCPWPECDGHLTGRAETLDGQVYAVCDRCSRKDREVGQVLALDQHKQEV